MVLWLFILLMLLIAMAFCATINTTIEIVAYRPITQRPRLAPLITAIGMSFILQNIGLVWKGAPTRLGRRTSSRTGRSFTIGGVHVHVEQVHRPPVHDPRAHRPHVSRAADTAREGDARDRAGPRRRRDDGDQRQPHDLVHVLPRRLPGRLGGLLYALYFTNIRYTEGFRVGPDRASPPRFSAGSETCRARCSARS